MAMLSVVERRPTSWSAPIENIGRAQVFREKSCLLPGSKCRVFLKLEPDTCFGSVSVFNAKTGETGWRTSGKWCLCVAWKPDGAKLAVGTENAADIFAAASGHEELSLPHCARVLSVAWGFYGQKLATGCVDKILRVFDSDSGVLEQRYAHSGAVRSIAWHPNHFQLASGSSDRILRIFDTSSTEAYTHEVHADSLNSIVWNSDGSRLATGCSGRHLTVFDTSTRITARLLKLKHKDAVKSVSWRADGEKLATGCNDKCAYVFDVAEGRQDLQLRHGASVSCVAWRPSLHHLATASADKCVRIFDTTDGSQMISVRYDNQLSFIAWQLGVSDAEPDADDIGQRPAIHRTLAVLMAPPGGGKGTIGKRMVKDFGFHHISTGDVLRAEIVAGSALGVRAEQFMRAGNLVPDDLMVKLVLQETQRAPSNRILLDGFPRTEPQAKELEKHMDVAIALNLIAPVEELLQRASNRWLHQASGRTYANDYNPPKIMGFDDVTGEPLVQRIDDKPDVVRRRIASHRARTTPVLAYYRQKGILQEFDGENRPSLLTQGRRSDAIYVSLKMYVEQQLGNPACPSERSLTANTAVVNAKTAAAALTPFSNYYITHIRCCAPECFTQCYEKFRTGTLASKDDAKSCGQAKLAASSVPALVPFSAYYHANMQTCPKSFWDAIYSSFS